MKNFYKGWYFDRKYKCLGSHGFIYPRFYGLSAWIAGQEKEPLFFNTVKEFKEFALKNPPKEYRVLKGIK